MSYYGAFSEYFGVLQKDFPLYCDSFTLWQNSCLFSSARIFRLEILCVNFVRTVGSVHIVIIPSITEFQSGKNLTLQAATVLLYCRLILVTGSSVR